MYNKTLILIIILLFSNECYYKKTKNNKPSTLPTVPTQINTYINITLEDIDTSYFNKSNKNDFIKDWFKNFKTNIKDKIFRNITSKMREHSIYNNTSFILKENEIIEKESKNLKTEYNGYNLYINSSITVSILSESIQSLFILTKIILKSSKKEFKNNSIYQHIYPNNIISSKKDLIKLLTDKLKEISNLIGNSIGNI